ncbi:MAG: bifunctional phosphoribosylaminoimidazolecarboxamide formyltransferase/IMP cyclohydrolase [Peptococcaceae bacterium]|jgi:phosphoribosylaminoimidazolecarboxamide formyltransferase/IMP cyclohydrolase|nr:bifunctional phosphoribosylaminoimidazolecarboxamide formyltransferase/IMP cyclohydrolase [Peptococcaceae bacterium]
MKYRALISVADKQGLEDFARGLVPLGFELISTGGTYQTLADAQIPVRYISEITGFPEILDGRVKTLHPKIHGGILARKTEEHRQQMTAEQIKFIDLVVVNLYPFRQTIAKPGVTFAEAIENIDIGGPAMARSAAKNHERVTVVVDPARYQDILRLWRQEDGIPEDVRRQLAAEAFAHTAEYDRLIAGYLEQSIVGAEAWPACLRFSVRQVQKLRYGENPQQQAALYADPDQSGTLVSARQLQGKELSYNNWMDMDAAWGLATEVDGIACVIIKHTNPCGTAVGQNVLEAYQRALAADPVSAYGGILAFNRSVDETCAQALKEHFYEVIIAPEFSAPARAILSAKKNLRLMEADMPNARSVPTLKIRSIQGGYLIQEEDTGTTPEAEWFTVTETKPTEQDVQELKFAWQIVKHVKSNAIVLVKNGQSIGVGAGQMNRVGSVKIALAQARDLAQGAYLASDAFFPFADSLAEAAQAGIRAVIQPGGSIRDEEVIAAANRAGIIMVFTQRRHFRH